MAVKTLLKYFIIDHCINLIANTIHHNFIPEPIISELNLDANGGPYTIKLGYVFFRDNTTGIRAMLPRCIDAHSVYSVYSEYDIITKITATPYPSKNQCSNGGGGIRYTITCFNIYGNKLCGFMGFSAYGFVYL